MATPIFALGLCVLLHQAPVVRTKDGRYVNPSVRGRAEAINPHSINETRVEFKLSSKKRGRSPFLVWRAHDLETMLTWRSAVLSASQVSPPKGDPNAVWTDSDDIIFVHNGGWVVTFRITDPSQIGNLYGPALKKLYEGAKLKAFPPGKS